MAAPSIRTAVVAFALLSGCTFINDLDIEQCAKDADCAKHGTAYEAYVCLDNVCKASLPCTNDMQCQDRGGALEDYICSEQQVCVAPGCTSDEDCQEELERPTASCTMGRCGDSKWGCLDDTEEPRSQPMLKFTAKVQDLDSDRAPADLEAFVCSRTDVACATPLAGPYLPYDTAGNIELTIKNLPASGFDGFIKFKAPSELPLEFHFVKTPLTHDFKSSPTTPFAMLPPGTMKTFGELVGKDVDETSSGLLVLRLFDCENQPASGVTLTLTASEALDVDDAFFFTSDDTYLPNVTAKATDDNGVAGLANVPAGIVTVHVIHAATEFQLYDFQLAMNPGTFALSFIYADDL